MNIPFLKHIFNETVLQNVLCIMCITFGILNHYIYMELRTATPWRLFSRSILRPYEFEQYESVVAAKLMHFEIVHFYMLAVEKNLVGSVKLLLCFYFSHLF